jgi:signal transduction histidine kinase
MDGGTAIWWRWLGSPVGDTVLAVCVTAVLLFGSYSEGHPQQLSNQAEFDGRPVPHPTAALLLVAVACLALAWRRRRPVAVLAVSTSAAVVYSLLGYVNGSVLLAPVLALYAVATLVSVRRAVAATVATLVLLMAATAANNPLGHITGGGFDLIPGLVAVAFFAGIAVASRRAYAASVQDRAEQDVRRRLDEERLRIARELHDVVAHTMATINVQAGVAAHVLSTRPEAAAESLQVIRAASKDGLRELRAILNVLRQADDADPTKPVPRTAQLDGLIAGACQDGLATTLTVTGTPVPLPAAVDLAVYRIIQESLTNAIRHAGPASAAVSLSYHDDELRVVITDNGRGQTPSAASTADQAGGHGLAGMRERAAAVGGTVEAGPGPAAGFQVTARLPLPESAPEDAHEDAHEDAPEDARESAPEDAREGARP